MLNIDIICEILKYLNLEDLIKVSKILLNSKNLKSYHITKIQKYIFELNLNYSIKLKNLSIDINDELICDDKKWINSIAKFHPIEFRKLSYTKTPQGDNVDYLNYFLRNGILAKSKHKFVNSQYTLSRSSDFIYCIDFEKYVNIKIFSNNSLIDSKDNVKSYTFGNTILPIYLIPFSSITIEVDELNYNGDIIIYSFMMDVDNRILKHRVGYDKFEINLGTLKSI